MIKSMTVTKTWGRTVREMVMNREPREAMTMPTHKGLKMFIQRGIIEPKLSMQETGLKPRRTLLSLMTTWAVVAVVACLTR